MTLSSIIHGHVHKASTVVKLERYNKTLLVILYLMLRRVTKQSHHRWLSKCTNCCMCKLIWRYWTYKMSVRYILSCVWVRLSIFSLLSIIQYVGLYVFSLPIPLVVIERIYILCLSIIIKSEVWTITHCLGLGHETMVSAVCLFILLWVKRIESWVGDDIFEYILSTWFFYFDSHFTETFLIARLMRPAWGPSGADRTQVGPMLVPWTLLSGMF